MSYFKGKLVAVTGAGGSIGSEICARLREEGADIVAIARSEDSLYRLQKRVIIWQSCLADVTDYVRMRSVLRCVDTVIHAAAHKHVPICEQEVAQAVQNNVLGTNNVLAAAAQEGVKQFVLISTDKAVNPSSVMGMTKQLAERVVRAYGDHPMKRTIVRFGNVIDSSGSVLPLWREQLAAGKKITLTDKRCERYFMSVREAAGLVLGAAELPSGTYVFDMGEPLNMYKVACTMTSPDNIEVIGLRPGEKLSEQLYENSVKQTSIDRVLRVML